MPIEPDLNSEDLNEVCHIAAKAARSSASPETKLENIAVSMIVRSGNERFSGDFQGDQWFYPASVAKLFHMVYTLHLVESDGLIITPELNRALTDMIQLSCNDATCLVVDTFSKALGGPELFGPEWEKWKSKRDQINQWFDSVGYKEIDASQKTWNESPFGRERQIRGETGLERNRLSANLSLRLLEQVMDGSLLSTVHGNDLAKNYLERKVVGPKVTSSDEQVRDFVGAWLPADCQLWSKAGWTDEVSHDVTWIQFPFQVIVGLAIFTRGIPAETPIYEPMVKSILNSLNIAGVV